MNRVDKANYEQCFNGYNSCSDSLRYADKLACHIEVGIESAHHRLYRSADEPLEGCCSCIRHVRVYVFLLHPRIAFESNLNTVSNLHRLICIVRALGWSTRFPRIFASGTNCRRLLHFTWYYPNWIEQVVHVHSRLSHLLSLKNKLDGLNCPYVRILAYAGTQ